MAGRTGKVPAAEVIAAFTAERDPLVQFNLVIVLGRRLSRDPAPAESERTTILAFFASALTHRHPWVRIEALYQLGLTKDPRHLDAIRRAYGDDSDLAFLHAVIATATILGQIDPGLTPAQVQRIQEARPKLGDNAAATRELADLAKAGVF